MLNEERVEVAARALFEQVSVEADESYDWNSVDDVSKKAACKIATAVLAADDAYRAKQPNGEPREAVVAQEIFNSLSDSADELGGWNSLDDESFTDAARRVMRCYARPAAKQDVEPVEVDEFTLLPLIKAAMGANECDGLYGHTESARAILQTLRPWLRIPTQVREVPDEEAAGIIGKGWLQGFFDGVRGDALELERIKALKAAGYSIIRRDER